jgi:hypothetical protein
MIIIIIIFYPCGFPSSAEERAGAMLAAAAERARAAAAAAAADAADPTAVLRLFSPGLLEAVGKAPPSGAVAFQKAETRARTQRLYR